MYILVVVGGLSPLRVEIVSGSVGGSQVGRSECKSVHYLYNYLCRGVAGQGLTGKKHQTEYSLSNPFNYTSSWVRGSDSGLWVWFDTISIG